MTPTRWFIAIFWVVVIVMCAKSFYDYNTRLDHEEKVQEEKHWFPPPLPSAAPQTQSPDADVRQVSYVVGDENPHGATFTTNLTIKNFGLKKATDIQVRVLPYVSNTDSKTQPGPDEVLNPNAVDQMANNFQWIEFADLGPGESATKTLTFPVRTDADPRTRFEPKILFGTAKDKP
jgi:hypothetical protein